MFFNISSILNKYIDNLIFNVFVLKKYCRIFIYINKCFIIKSNFRSPVSYFILVIFKNTFKVASKYIDNAGINNLEELKKFLWVYRNSYDNKLIQIKSEIKVKSRDLILSKLISNKKILGVLKNMYQRF